jgi:hypothetical protein
LIHLEDDFFDFFHRLADGNRSPKVEKNMHVIINGVDERRRAAKILQDRRHVSMRRFAHRVIQQRLAVLRAEDQVNIQPRERLRHTLGRPCRAFVDGSPVPQGVALGWS